MVTFQGKQYADWRAARAAMVAPEPEPTPAAVAVAEPESEAEPPTPLLQETPTPARRVWQDETGGELPADVLQKVMARATSGGRLSFRRVVQALVPMLATKGR